MFKNLKIKTKLAAVMLFITVIPQFIIGLFAYIEIVRLSNKTENFASSLGQSISGKFSEFCIDQAKDYALQATNRYANEINNAFKRTSEQVESIVLSLEKIYKNKVSLPGRILPLPEMKPSYSQNDRSNVSGSIFCVDLKNSTNDKFLAYNLPEYSTLSKKNIYKANIGDVVSFGEEKIRKIYDNNVLVSSNYAPKEIVDEIKLISNVEYIAEPMYRTNSEIENICVGTKTGISYSISEFNNYSRFLPSVSDWYKKSALNSDRTVWKEVYKSIFSGKYCVTCSRAFKDQKGNVLGVAAIDMNLEKISGSISDPDLGGDSYTFVLDENGKILVCQDYEDPDLNKEPLKDENLDEKYRILLENIIKNKSGVQVSYLPNFNQDYVVAFAPIENTSWILTTAVPLKSIENMSSNINEDITGSISSGVKDLREKNRSKLGLYLFLFLFLIFISFLLSLVLSKLIVGPLLKLVDGVKDIGNGNFENKVYIDSKDEVGQLAKEFNKMADNLKDYVKKLEKTTVEKVKLNSELNVAKTIQEDMLPCIFPKFSNQKAYDVFATMKPAKAVGGDFYDFFVVDKYHLALVIADVSGKSISAALFMVITKTLIKNYACLGFGPEKVFDIVNKRLCENNKAGMFVTSFIAIVNLKTGEVNYCNAGHNKPLLYSSKNQKFEWLDTKHGFVLAGIDTVKYKKESFILNSGDALYLYTDGVTEAVNEKEELYSDDRLLDTLNSINIKDTSSEQILKNIQESVGKFSGRALQADDITMLMFKFFGDI